MLVWKRSKDCCRNCRTRALFGIKLHKGLASGQPDGEDCVRGYDLNAEKAGSVMDAFENLKKLVVAAEDDVKRAEGGNKAAGVRVRAQMQDIKAASQEVREKILTLRDSEKPA